MSSSPWPGKPAECLAALRDHLADAAEGDGPSELDVALALLDTASTVVVVLDAARTIVYANSRFAAMVDVRPDALVGRTWSDAALPTELVDGLAPALTQATSAASTARARAAAGGGRVIDWHVRAVTGRSPSLLCVGHDVDARDDPSALEISYQLLEGSFDASTVALAYLDRDMRFLRVNRAYATADNKDPADFIGKGHFDLFPNADNERIFSQVRDTGEAYSVLAKPFRYAKNPERGVTHWDWTLTPVKNADGHVTSLVLALRDVTERVRAIETLQDREAEIARQLAEKKVLLNEVHHRVKNNLQVICSLLYLQSTQVEDQAVAALFDDSRARVQAMSLVHELLYSSDNFAEVDFGAYLTRLAEAVKLTYASPETEVDVSIDVSAPPLGVDLAIPCGLIASELLTNAFKHAFAASDRGSIRVALTQLDGGRVALEVRDNGAGMRHSATDDSTLGLRLVRTLTNQLDGALEVDAGDGRGSAFRITFPTRDTATPPATST